MRDPTDATAEASRREPWNKGKLVGAKPPLRPKHVWSIRTKLQIAGRTRDLAMFHLAIDSSSEDATSSACGWRTLLRMVTLSTVRLCARRRPASPLGLR